MNRPPSVFVPHGSPMILLEDCPARRFLGEYAAETERPSAILMISAHWETPGVEVGSAERPETIHDFYGFPEPMYRVRYGAAGAPDVARSAAEMLRAGGLETLVEPQRGLDHGGWVPLMFMYPQADVPVAQVSIQTHLGPRHHLEVGRALAPLRDDGVMIVCSGNLTHGLREMNRDGVNDPPHPWVAAFSQWIFDAVTGGRVDDVVNYRALAPDAERNHPTEDHFLPLLVALGAGGPEAVPKRIHASTTYRTLSMDAYAFH